MIKLGEYVEQAWSLVGPTLLEELRRRVPAEGRVKGSGGPVLLYDAGVLARYRAMDRLYALAEAARAGGNALWLLCPTEDPGQLPRLDGEVVRVGDNEWVALPDAWVVNAHRSAAAAS